MSNLYRKISSTFVLSVLGLGIAFIFQIVLGRILNPKLYGEYTMYITYSTLFSMITMLGMDRNLIKEIARFDSNILKEKALLKFACVVSLFVTLIFSIILILSRAVIGFSNFGVLLLISMLATKTFIGIIDGFLQGKGSVIQVTFINSVLNNTLKIVFFTIFTIVNLNSFYSAIYSFLLSEVITLILRLTNISKHFERCVHENITMSRNAKLDFLKYSVTVASITGISLLLQNVDKIMISALLDYDSVGVYRVVQNYVNLISMFISPFIAFWPMISKLYNENKISEIEYELKKIVNIVTSLVIPMFFLFLFLGNELLAIFGAGYVTDAAKSSLVILAFCFLIDAVSGPIGSILTMTRYAKLALYNNIASLLINISLSYLLIGKLGIVGVAIATGVSIVFNNLISIIQVKLFLGIFAYDFRSISKIFALGLFNYYSCFVLVDNLPIINIYARIIVIGTILYTVNALILAFTLRSSIKGFLRKKRWI